MSKEQDCHLLELGIRWKFIYKSRVKDPVWSVDDKSMSQEDNSNMSTEEEPMFHGNSMLGEQVDIYIKQGNMMRKDIVKVMDKRKRGGSL